MPSAATPTCFGGRLVQRGPTWVWNDGAVEPLVADVPTELADLRTRDEPRGAVVEVPARLARIYDAMQWVIDGYNRGDYDVDVSTGAFPALGRATSSTSRDSGRRAPGAATAVMVILVPLREWSAWTSACAVLPGWAPGAEDDLVKHATDRGWSEGWSAVDRGR